MDLITVAAYPTAAMAHLAKNLLETEGITAFIADEAEGDMLHLSSPFGGAKLQVATKDVAAARKIIESAERHELARESAEDAEKHSNDPVSEE